MTTMGEQTGILRDDLYAKCHNCGLAVKASEVPEAERTRPPCDYATSRAKCPACGELMPLTGITPEALPAWLARKQPTGRGFRPPNPKYQARAESFETAAANRLSHK